MLTPKQRSEQAMKIANDELLEVQDKLKFIYHWMRFEYALIAEKKAEKRKIKHALAMQKLITIFNFQHDLEKV